VNREFQARYRATAGPIETVNIIAESAEDVRGELLAAGYLVLGVTLVRAVVDWQKPVWDLDEFAAAMNIKGGTLSGKKGAGTIPWNATIGGVPRTAALKWFEKNLNEAGEKLLSPSPA
jgi:hypothetical protein